MTATAAPVVEFEPDLVAGNVKAAMKTADAVSRDFWMVDVGHLEVLPDFNVRERTTEYEAHVEGLTASIIANGYYQDKPLAGFVAKKGDEQVIYIVDGASRLEAVRRAIERGHSIERLPVVTKPQGTTLEDLTVQLYRGNGGRPLTPYETGVVCKRLESYGLDRKKVAERLGLTTAYVTDLLALVGAPRQLREMVTKGEVSATTAMKELAKSGDKAVPRLEEGLKKAKAAGKDRVTEKHLRPDAPAVEKPARTKKVAPAPTGTGLVDGALNRILEGLIVHGFENDADAEKAIRDQAPFIRRVLAELVETVSLV